MVKVGLIGAGKMGLSHLSILGANPDVSLVGICDTSKMVTDFLGKFGSFASYSDYKKMIQDTDPDAVVVAVPPGAHAPIIRSLMEKGKHVFVEKPFCLHASQGEELIRLARSNALINQVGYHHKFNGNFTELKRLIGGGWLGTIYHFGGECFGAVVTRKKTGSWRMFPVEGGGSLIHCATDVVDLLNDLLAPVSKVHGAIFKSVYSEDDAVYTLLELSNGITGTLAVNWSDETYEKMCTSITVMGTQGKVICDTNHIKIFIRDENGSGYPKGWSTKSITDFSDAVEFNLKEEEYSAQLDYFIKAIKGSVPNNINTFESAWMTDKAISLIRNFN